MELSDYLVIWKKERRLFWAVVFFSVAAAASWQMTQPVSFQATLLVNIGRENMAPPEQYAYDGFYRLQADERFADTVVRWLEAPRVVEDIYRAAGLETSGLSSATLKNIFTAKRLSSQMIEVTYTHADKRTLEKISSSTVAVLNAYADSLNTESGDPGWFRVIGSDPVIRDARVPLVHVLATGLAFGLFAGFWIGLFRHYFFMKKGDAHRD